MLLLPSVRSLAYMEAFRGLSLCPAEIVLMSGPVPMLGEVRCEGRSYSYAERYFDLSLDLESFAEESGARLSKVQTRDANADVVRDALGKCSSKYFIYTGGGILNRELLGMGKKFIHVHPGLIPDYRGSTCFYYSLLAERSLGSTAFVMTEGIDRGAVVSSSRFRVNCKTCDDQPFFWDYIADPYIRSITLGKVISDFRRCGNLQEHVQTGPVGRDHYIMHPLLRHLAIDRANSGFDACDPEGIFEIEA